MNKLNSVAILLIDLLDQKIIITFYEEYREYETISTQGESIRKATML